MVEKFGVEKSRVGEFRLKSPGLRGLGLRGLGLKLGVGKSGVEMSFNHWTIQITVQCYVRLSLVTFNH